MEDLVAQAAEAGRRLPVNESLLPVRFPSEDDHRVSLGDGWSAAQDNSMPAGFRGCTNLSRGELFAFARGQHREKAPKWRELLALSNAWG